MKALALIALALVLEGGFLLTATAGSGGAGCGAPVQGAHPPYAASLSNTASTAAPSSPPTARTSGASGGS